MGHFLAVTAVHNAEPVGVAKAVEEYVSAYAVRTQRPTLPDGAWPDERRDTLVFPADNNWVAILWPAYFNIHDFPAALWLSQHQSTLVSTVNVYHDECWSHGLFENGLELDRFCSIPDLGIEDQPSASQERERCKGDPSILAEKFGVPEECLAPYLVYMGYEEPAGVISRVFSRFRKRPAGKVHPSDEFELKNFWVFTDFWRHAGIAYPDPADYSIIIRLSKDFSNKLPMIE
jgi:hypothetical protein